MESRTIGYVIHESVETAPDAKILTESSDERFSDIITKVREGEKRGAPHRVIIQATLQEADALNRNGRIYSKSDLFPALNDARIKELLKTGNLFCENGHPIDDMSLRRQQTIYMPLTCARILHLFTEGNLIKGIIKGSNNQYGEDFNNDLLDGQLPSWSLRALGVLKQQGGKTYVKNLKIITYDRVVYCSFPNAYTDKIVSESADIDKKQEGYVGRISPINIEQAMGYITEQSNDLKAIREQFGIMDNSLKLTNRNSKVQFVTEQGDTMVLNLDKYITKELRDWCSRV